MFLIKLFSLVLFVSTVPCICSLNLYTNGTYNYTYNLIFNNSAGYVIEYPHLHERSFAVVNLFSPNALEHLPLMVVVRQRKRITSWQIPFSVCTEKGPTFYQTTSRKLCEDIFFKNKNATYPDLESYFEDINVEPDSPIIQLSTKSSSNINVTLTVREEFFIIEPNHNYSATISPTESNYYFYNFPGKSNATDNFETVILKVQSNDKECITASIQNATGCPVYDLNDNIKFNGYYETVKHRGGITISRSKFPNGFYVVFVVNGDDTQCSQKYNSSSNANRQKTITFMVKSSMTFRNYIIAVVATLCVIGVFYLVFGTSFYVCIRCSYIPRNIHYTSLENTLTRSADHNAENEANQSDVVVVPDNSTRDSQLTRPTSYYDAETFIEHNVENEANQSDVVEVPDNSTRDSQLTRSTSNAETFIEHNVENEANQSNVVLIPNSGTRDSQVYLSALTRRDFTVLQKESHTYLWQVLIVSVFYALPVVQLVIHYQNVLNDTGNQDLCYYNFLCAHPLGFFSDFNHFFSNCAYILLGGLFLIIVYRREKWHIDPNFDHIYGIPQHFGLYYALGVALIMEGVLSASYHICPNQSNYQFDTTFMYVIAILCMVKLYQNRHPNFDGTVYTFGVLTITILFGMIGVLDPSVSIWVIFSLSYVVFCLYLTMKIYYRGNWRFNVGIFRLIFYTCRNDGCAGILQMIKPQFKDRMVLLVIGNIINWLMAGLGPLFFIKIIDFDTYLLAILIFNTVLYLTFYICMKLKHGEGINKQCLLFLALSIICLIPAMVFFIMKATSSELTPARSRHSNHECIQFLQFYDYHDVWHFLSAVAIFFGFMMLLTLDDNLSHINRRKIHVF